MIAANLKWKVVFCSLVTLWAMTIAPLPARAALFSQSSPDLTFGAPTWYSDLNLVVNPAALSLMACVDVADGLCVLPLAGEEPDWNPVLPPTFGPPVNFPSEPFYHLVEAGLALNGGGTAFLRIALEFAFGGVTGDPVDGEQITFNRVRHRIDAPVIGRYRITHPWGTFEQDVLSLGVGFEINSTVDEGCAPPPFPCDFNLALLDAPGRITGPFLRWNTGFPVIGAVSGAAYLGDPAIPHTITGSVHDADPGTGVQPANLYRVEVDTDFAGPNGFVTLGETNLFSVMGRLAPSLQARADTASTQTSTAVSIAVLANDTPNAGQTLVPGSVAIVALSEVNGTADPQLDGTVLFTPITGFNGTASFRYTVGDSTPATSNEATVTITVSPNVAPVATANNATTNMNSPVDINVAGNDTDADGNLAPGSIAIVTPPAQGTALLNTPAPGWIRYTPNPGFFGLDTFAYTIQDVPGLVSAPALVSVTVIPGQTVDITFASLGLRLGASGTTAPAPGSLIRPSLVQMFAGIGPPTGPVCGGMTFIGNARLNRRTGFWRFAMSARIVRLRLGGVLPSRLCASIPGGGVDNQAL